MINTKYRYYADKGDSVGGQFIARVNKETLKIEFLLKHTDFKDKWETARELLGKQGKNFTEKDIIDDSNYIHRSEDGTFDFSILTENDENA